MSRTTDTEFVETHEASVVNVLRGDFPTLDLQPVFLAHAMGRYPAPARLKLDLRSGVD